MTVCEEVCHRRGRSRLAAWVKGLARHAREAWRRACHEAERNRQRHSLLDLDDRMLKDIGLSRADAQRIVMEKSLIVDERYRSGDRKGDAR